MWTKYRRRWTTLLATLPLLCCARAISGGDQPAAPSRSKVQEVTVHGTSLEGNLDNDPADRQVSVYLPPSYERDMKRRYPTVYFLHGFGDTNAKWVGADPKWINLRDIIDRNITAGAREFIAVVPNAYTRFEGSFYSNSIVTGNWEDFVTTDLVRYIDAHFRTLPNRESRGLAGHSMGGYGTIRIAMHHPEIFGTIYALSACCLNWGGDFQPAGALALKLRSLHTEAEVAQADPSVHMWFAMAAAWSPNAEKAPFYVDFPAVGGEQARLEIVAKWSANLPLAALDQYRVNLQKLRAIAFDVGDQDDFAHVPLVAKQFDEALNSYKIAHAYETYPGTHWSKIPERLETRVVPFFSKNLVFPAADKPAAAATK